MRIDDERLLSAEQRLAVINHRINTHVLNSYPMAEARRVASQYRTEGRAVTDHALAKQGLPTLANQGKALFLGLASLARLNRRRIRLERRIARLKTAQSTWPYKEACTTAAEHVASERTNISRIAR